MSSDEEQYDVFHPDAIKRLLKPDSVYFANFVSYNFSQIAALYKCSVTMSMRRSFEAEVSFRRDYNATLKEMNEQRGTKSLDYFKLAGFLSYWLRRRVVIEGIEYQVHPTLTDKNHLPYPVQETFTQYGNELGSFLLGYQICLRGEADQNEFHAFMDREGYLRTVMPFLKEKNVSPHALHLIYRSLFEGRRRSL